MSSLLGRRLKALLCVMRLPSRCWAMSRCSSLSFWGLPGFFCADSSYQVWPFIPDRTRKAFRVRHNGSWHHFLHHNLDSPLKPSRTRPSATLVVSLQGPCLISLTPEPVFQGPERTRATHDETFTSTCFLRILLVVASLPLIMGTADTSGCWPPREPDASLLLVNWALWGSDTWVLSPPIRFNPA